MKKSQFSLIEIALSLGVAFLAVTILIAFFPTSFKRIDNAQTNTYVANNITHFKSYIKNTLITQPAPDYIIVDPTKADLTGKYSALYTNYLTQWVDNINYSKTGNSDPAQNTEDANPLPVERKADSATFTAALTDYDAIPNTAPEGVHITQHKTIKSLYVIRTITKMNEGEANEVNLVDNVIEARIWKGAYTSSLMTNPYFGYRTVKHSSTDYNKNARVIIELSWPILVPYGERTKKTSYFVDIVK